MEKQGEHGSYQTNKPPAQGRWGKGGSGAAQLASASARSRQTIATRVVSFLPPVERQYGHPTRASVRGTGDVDACYRMMAYDRGMLARAGTGFEVLESQATPGVERCRVRLGPVNAWQPGTRSARG